MRPGSSTWPVSVAASSSARLNQRASLISSPSTVTSVDVAVATNPTIRLAGRGHGWLPK